MAPSQNQSPRPTQTDQDSENTSLSTGTSSPRKLKVPYHKQPEGAAFDPSNIQLELLNNFFGYLPGGFMRSFWELARMNFDLPVQDVLIKLSPKQADEAHSVLAGHSERFLKGTLRQFIESIDQAIKQSGYSDRTISRLAKPKNPSTLSSQFAGTESRDELALYRIYLILRQAGYSQKDLTC